MADFEETASLAFEEDDGLSPLHLHDPSTKKARKHSPHMRRHVSEPINLAKLSLSSLGLIDDQKDEEEHDAPKFNIDQVKEYMHQNPVQCADELQGMTQKLTHATELNVSKTVIDQLLDLLNHWIQHHGVNAIHKQQEYSEKCNALTLQYDKQRRTLQHTIEEYKNECEEQQQQRKASDIKNEELSIKLNDTTQQLNLYNHLKEQNERLLDDLESKTTENEHHKKTILAQQKNINELETAKNQFAKMVDTQNSKLSQMALMENEIKKKMNEMNDVNEKYKAMEAQLESIKTDKEELFKEKTLMHDQLTNYGKLKDNVAQSEENEKALKQRIIALTKKNNDLNTEMNMVQKQESLIQTECDELQRQRKRLETENKELAAKLKVATKQNVVLQEQNAGLMEEFDCKAAENEIISQGIILKQKIIKQLQTEKMDFEKLVEVLNNKLSTMAVLENERKEMETECERLKMEKIQSEQQDGELKDEIVVLQQRNHELNNEIDALNDVVQSYSNPNNMTGHVLDIKPRIEEGSFVGATLGNNEHGKRNSQYIESTWHRTVYRSFTIVGLGCLCYLAYRQMYCDGSDEKVKGMQPIQSTYRNWFSYDSTNPKKKRVSKKAIVNGVNVHIIDIVFILLYPRASLKRGLRYYQILYRGASRIHNLQ
eukprot:26938_1